jgi:tetratricopeptide (TPR) repeat protein
MVKFFSSRSPEKNFLVKCCDTFVTASIAAIFFLVPLFFTGLAVQGFIFEKVVLFYLLVLIALVAWITKGVALGELKITRTPLDIPILALAVVLLVSSFLSVDILSSFIGAFGSATKTFIAFLVYVTFYYLVVNNLTERRIWIFAWSLALSAIAMIFYAALQISGVFILPFSLTRVSSFNPIGSSSSLGVFIAAVLPLLAVFIPAVLYGEGKSLLQKTLVIALKALFFVAVLTGIFILFLLNKFIFWPAAIAGIVIILMFSLSKIVKLKQADSVLPVVVFLVLVIFLVGGNFNLVTAQLPTEVSLSRSLSWDIAKESLKHNPLFGSGPATFDYSFVKYRGSAFNISDLWNVRFDSAQGMIFELLATIGVLGTFGVLVIGLIAVSIAFIYLTKSKMQEQKILLLGIFSALAIFVLDALFLTVSGTIILCIVLYGSFAIALIVNGYPEKFKELSLSFRSSPKYALALSSLFLLVSAGVVVLFTGGFKVYLADVYARRAVQSADSKNAVDYLNRAIATADYQGQYYLRLSRLYMNLANQEAQRGGAADVAAIQNYLSLAITAGKRAVELAPNNVVDKESIALLYENAAAYNISGALEWAEKYYADITALEPDNPSAYIRLALINMAYANRESSDTEKKHYYDEALKFYQKAVEEKANLAPAYYGMAIVYERGNDYAKAIEQLSQAASLEPANLDYRFELGRMFYNRGISASGLDQQQSDSITGASGEADAVDANTLSVNEGSAPPSTASNQDVQSARTIFENILQASPNHANAIYSLALIAEASGDREKARGYYERLVNIVSDQPTKDAILAKLQAL